MPDFTLNDNQTREVDLGNTKVMTIQNISTVPVKVYIDYKRTGSTSFTSAIKASAGYGDPFSLAANATKVVNKSDLESEHVRLAVQSGDIKVIY